MPLGRNLHRTALAANGNSQQGRRLGLHLRTVGEDAVDHGILSRYGSRLNLELGAHLELILNRCGPCALLSVEGEYGADRVALLLYIEDVVSRLSSVLCSSTSDLRVSADHRVSSNALEELRSRHHRAVHTECSAGGVDLNVLHVTLVGVRGYAVTHQSGSREPIRQAESNTGVEGERHRLTLQVHIHGVLVGRKTECLTKLRNACGQYSKVALERAETVLELQRTATAVDAHTEHHSPTILLPSEVERGNQRREDLTLKLLRCAIVALAHSKRSEG